MTRTVPEWVGKTPDTPIPDRVRLRVFEKHGGRCHVSGRKIRPGEPWDVDHVTALCNWSGDGHGNRESNLAPVLRDKHRAKTAEDVHEKAVTYRKRKKHVGVKPKRRAMIPGSRDSRWKKKLSGETVRR